VSTKSQAKEGNSLEAQELVLRENGAQIIFFDNISGVKTERPELSKLLKALNKGDTLVVTKLDRIARSLSQGSELVNELVNREIRVNIINIGVMDISPASKLIRNIFFSFAEFERDMLLERTREGREIARRDPNYREGRPKKYGTRHIEHALYLLKTHTYKQVCELTGISKSTIIRAKKSVDKKAKNI